MIKLGIVLLIIILVLKILNVIYNHMSINQNEQHIEKKEFELIKSSVSYEQFQKVSKETLVHNSQVRAKGDFIDFLINNLSFSSNSIENNILKINYGE